MIISDVFAKTRMAAANLVHLQPRSNGARSGLDVQDSGSLSAPRNMCPSVATHTQASR